MNDATDTERRLLVAFLLTFLVLVGWPILTHRLGWVPSETQKIGTLTPPEHKKQDIYGIIPPQIPMEQVIIREINTQSTQLGFSDKSGSLAAIHIAKPAYRTTAEELQLLTPRDGPGLGAVAWVGPPVAWEGWQPVEDSDRGGVTYHGQAAPGLLAKQQFTVTQAARNSFSVVLQVTNQTPTPQTVQPRLLAGRFLRDPLEQGRYRLLRAHVAGKIRTIPPKAGGQRRWEGEVGWVTAQTKYYTAILEPEDAPSALIVARDDQGQSQAWLEYPAATLAPGQTQAWRLRGYAGPLDYRFLDALKLDHAVSLGAFTTVTRLLRAGMLALSNLSHSYGAAIVGLTVALSLLFYPLTWASFTTMKRMELVQPEIKALQERYRQDPRRLNEEVMKVYRKHRVNPLSGCLPLLFQMPIFIALYQALSRSPELRGARFLLIHDLSAPDALLPLPVPLPFLGAAINVLPLAMGGVMFLQQRLSMSRRALTDEQRIQQQVFRFMPILFSAAFYSLPSGLVLYWLLSTTFTVIQQRFVHQRFAG